MEKLNHFTATGFVFNKSKQILMIKHKKLGVWLPPGGHIDENELPCDAVKREIFEETGAKVSVLSAATGPGELVNSCELPLPMEILLEDINGDGSHNHIDMIYLCVADDDKLSPQENEVDGIGWFTLDAVMKLDTFENVYISVQKAVRFMDDKAFGNAR